MITRIDNPRKPNREMTGVRYNNKGSVARLKNYLIKNEDKYDRSDMFFTADKDNVSADAFYKMIDTNVKGLSRDEHKFYSLTINPSHEELQFINSDKEKLKEYVRAVMTDFNAAHKTITANDQLVWAAIIHHNRIITEKDLEDKPEGTKLKVGDIKEGENTHIHVVLSARDANQKKTITILSPKNKLSRNFELMDFQQNNQTTFQKMFGFKEGIDIYGGTQLNYRKNQLEKLKTVYAETYELSDIKKSGDKMKWASTFGRNITNMFRELLIDKKIVLHPTVYMEQGRKYYNENHAEARVPAIEIKNNPNLTKNTNIHKSSNVSHDYDIFKQIEMMAKRIEHDEIEYAFVKPKKKKRKRGLRPGMDLPW
ncbi:MAG TPA: DUF5712 family protein [Bacteroidia bacterium]